MKTRLLFILLRLAWCLCGPFPMRPERQPGCIRCGAEVPPAYVARPSPKAGEWGVRGRGFTVHPVCFFLQVQVFYDYATRMMRVRDG